ncbi:hypothetical protein TRFO_08902 [Tritrichomonas foetus]|uniref:Uncharacterized protein n=1 Tax=Tritrichomonas foetus TaxID=1144522 RepID=A0A1J4JM33_9EUKA|nr:hypothetical protein TRFO_08902 [Tritrichomonas foetus]|eukprot:OHS98332.1 hypothetical protein TRFO_08902 [Tritrichomonas foetus]
MLLFGFFHLLLCKPKDETFVVQRYIAGNWTTDSNNQIHTFYFIPIQNVNHYQALLNDKFLDIYIKSFSSVDISYMNYNFTLNFQNTNTRNPYAIAQIEPGYLIDVFIYTKDIIDVSLINETKNEIVVWTFKRPIPQLTRKDKFVLLSFFSCIIILVLYAIYYSRLWKSQKAKAKKSHKIKNH